MTYRVPLVESTWGADERAAIDAVLDSGHLTMGKKVLEFEEAFALHAHCKHAVMVTSGSMALLLAAFWYAENIGRHKAVMPALTWPTTAWSFIAAGCPVWFRDVNPETLLMEIQPGVTGGFLHVPVNLMGNRADLPFSGRTIVDNCEAMQPHMGDISCHSLFFSHHINTIEGGVVTTNDDRIADWMYCARAHGWSRQASKWFQEDAKRYYPEFDQRFLFLTMGFNMKPTEIAAAAGLVQLRKAEDMSDARLRAFREIAEGMDGLSARPLKLVGNASPLAFPILCPDKNTRNSLSTALEASGIETRPIAGGCMPRQPAFRKYADKWEASPLPGANKVHDCGFFVGLYPGMDTAYVVESIKESL